MLATVDQKFVGDIFNFCFDDRILLLYKPPKVANECEQSKSDENNLLIFCHDWSVLL